MHAADGHAHPYLVVMIWALRMNRIRYTCMNIPATSIEIERIVVETTGPPSCLCDDVKRCVSGYWVAATGCWGQSTFLHTSPSYSTLSSCWWLYVLIDLFMMIWPSPTTIIFLHYSTWRCLALCSSGVILFVFFISFAKAKFLFAFLSYLFSVSALSFSYAIFSWQNGMHIQYRLKKKKNLTCGRHSIHSFTDQELHEVRIQMFLSLEFPYNISFSFLFRVALFAIVVAGFFFVILFQWKDYISVRIHFQTGRRQSNRPNSFNWL